MFKQGHYAQILSLFTITHENHHYQLCYAQRFEPVAEEHSSGLPVAYTTGNMDYQGRFVARITGISHSIHLVPDFSCPMYSAISLYPYERYLVNYDISQNYWWDDREKGMLMTLPDDQLVNWSEQSKSTDSSIASEEEASTMAANEEQASAMLGSEEQPVMIDNGENQGEDEEDAPWYLA